MDFGTGRQGPAVNGGVPVLGQQKQRAAAPYRPDVATEDFAAVGDIVVAVLAPPRERSKGGIELVDSDSPFHVAISVGPKVAAELGGIEIEPGDVFCMSGSAFADTLAGRVWFVRAKDILSVVTPKDEPDAQAG